MTIINNDFFTNQQAVEFKLFSTNTPWLKASPDASKGEFPLPRYESDEAAALDVRVFMDEDQVTIAPGHSFKFRSGFGFHINNPWIAAHVLPRSGTGVKGLNLKNTIGLIDSDYQGELFLTAINTNPEGTDPIVVTRGDRLFQLVFVPVIRVERHWVEEFSATSKRGVGGFGSTGKN